MTYRCEEFYTEEEGIARNHLLAELHIIELHEVSTPALRLLQLVEDEQTATLCHSLYLENTRHNRFLREVTGEERLVAGYILYAHDAARPHSDDLIDQLHRVAVRQELTDADIIHDWLLVRIVDRSLNLVLANLLAHEAGELVVYGMAWTRSDDAALDRLADECHIADDIEQFMTCTFVLPLQWTVLDVTQLVGIHVRHLEMVGELVELSLFYLALVNNDGIVQVTTLDEVSLEQRHDIAYENEGTGRSNLLCVCLHLFEGSKLAVDEFTLERTHGCDAEVLVWKNGDNRPVIIFHLNLMADDVVIFLCILFLDAYALNLLYIRSSRTVEDRELRTIYLDETVVDAEGIEC